MSNRTVNTRILAGLLALMLTLAMAGTALAASKKGKTESLKFKDDTVVMTFRKGVTAYYLLSVKGASNTELNWSSSNKKIATVDAEGRVLLKKKGTCDITATDKNNDKRTATCTVIVKNAKPNKEKLIDELQILSQNKILTIEDGEKESVTLPIYLTPLNAGNIDLEWSSSNKKVAKVSAAGKVTAVSAGKCVITAAAKDGSGLTSECNIEVVEIAPNSDQLILDDTKITLKKGKTCKLNFHLAEKPEGNIGFAFGTDNADVANVVKGSTTFDMKTLEGTCEIKAVGKGSCTITVSLVGSKEESHVNVTVKN